MGENKIPYCGLSALWTHMDLVTLLRSLHAVVSNGPGNVGGGGPPLVPPPPPICE